MGVNRTSSFKNPFAIPPWIVGPNGGDVIYVCSLGVQNGIQDDIASRLYLTLGAAMNVCQANQGWTIVVLPGHVESVTTTPTFVAGVTIVGIGNGEERPTFNWTTAASQWSIGVNNVKIINCVLNFAATASTTVTKAITIAGTSCRISGCRIIMAASSTQLATTGIELTTGADKFIFGADKDSEEGSNTVYSPAAAAVTSPIVLTNAVDNVVISNNIFNNGLGTNGGSNITMTTAPTNIYIGYNVFANTKTGSTSSLVGIAAATGYVEYNTGYIQAATGGATAFGTLGNLQLTQNFGCAGAAKTGILIGTQSS